MVKAPILFNNALIKPTHHWEQNSLAIDVQDILLDLTHI